MQLASNKAKELAGSGPEDLAKSWAFRRRLQDKTNPMHTHIDRLIDYPILERRNTDWNYSS